MTTTPIAWRATVYAGRSVDSTEATVLTPAAGAVHSDSFKVATRSGVSGFQPYLLEVSGRAGRLDPLTSHTDVGELTLTIGDVRTTAGGSNLERWITAYLGNAQQRRQLGGCKVKVERSADGGTTWTTWYTGRIMAVRVVGLLRYELRVQDLARELAVKCFIGRPHSSITYAGTTALLPAGPLAAFGTTPAIIRVTGSIAVWTTTQAGGNVYRGFSLDTDSQRRADNLATDAIFAALGYERTSVGDVVKAALYPRFENRLRARIKRLDTNAEGVFKVGAVSTVTRGGGVGTKVGAMGTVPVAVSGFAILPLDASDPDYLALPADGTSVNGYLYLDDVVSEANPLLIDDAHPWQLTSDILAGKFGRLTSAGAVSWSWPVQAADTGGRSGFTTRIADATLPTLRFVVTEPWEVWRFLEEQLHRPFRQAMRLLADGSALPLDLRLPSSLPATTITDADLAEPAVAWSEEPTRGIARVEAKRYSDTPTANLATLLADMVFRDGISTYLRRAASLYDAGAAEVRVVDLGATDLAEQVVQLDCQGLRSQPFETIDGLDRALWAQRIIERFAQELRLPFGRGPAYIPLVCRDTANTTDCQVGDFRVIDVDAVPDPATNKRGGPRVGLCLERQDVGPRILLTFLDVGINVVATAPTIGTPTKNSTDPEHAIDVVCTVNASSEAMELQVAVTATSVGTRPAATSALWAYGGYATATGTVVVRGLPNGQRVWVRVRTVPQATQYARLPSDWAFPSGTGYVDLDAITAPSAISVTVDGEFATYTFTMGNANLPTRVYLVTPTTDPLEYIETLPPGTDRGGVYGLTVSTQYKLALEHEDGVGGVSSQATATFTTNGTATAAPAAGTILLVTGAI